MNAQEDDRKQFLQPTVNAISTMLELPAAIWLVDETANVLRAIAVTELLEEKIGKAEIPLDTPNVGVEVFRSRQTKLIRSIDAEKDWRFKAEILSLGLQSAIVAPLPIKTRMVGVLVIYIPENKPSNLEELKPKAETSADQIAATLRHIQGLETLNEVGQLINSEIQSPNIFKRVLESAQRVLDCEHVSIFLADKNDDLILTATSSPYIKRKHFKTGEGLAGEVIQTKRSLFIPDVRNHPKFVKRLSMSIEERSMLLAPIIMSENQVIGVISCDFHGLNGFDSQDRMLLEAFTRYISTALQNRKLYQKEHDKAQALSELHKISHDILSVETLPNTRELLEKIAEKAKDVLKADLIELYEYNQDRNEFIFPSISAGNKIIPIQKKNIYKDDIVLNFIKQSKPYYIPHVQTVTAFSIPYSENQPEKRFIFREKIQSCAVIPLRISNENEGLMFANYRTSQAFPDEQKGLIELFASIAAIALDNARAYKQLKQIQSEIADKERELVISGLAMDFIHKMNNIAGTIPPWVSLIKRRLGSETDPKVIQYLDNIVRDTSYILKEANELRKPLAKPDFINMEELTGSVIAQIEMMTPSDIIFRFGPATDLYRVRGIKEHLSIVIHSVIVNSIRAISKQGEITINLNNLIKGTEKYLEINISDTGCGIPQGKTDSVFEYGTSLWQDKQGTGYGLWRARSIIQSMNGSIEVTHSEVRKGTTFTITLPCKK